MPSFTSVVVTDGDALTLSIAWSTPDGSRASPSAVQYQVFDRRTRASVSSIVIVSDIGSDMIIVIPGSNLPAGPTLRRGLVVQIEATFVDDIHTEMFPVEIAKRYTFSG